jgi:hypothetical protein
MSGGVQTRGSKKREEIQMEEPEANQGKSEHSEKVKVSKKIETAENESEVERLRQVENLKTVVKTLASNFSGQKVHRKRSISLLARVGRLHRFER